MKARKSVFIVDDDELFAECIESAVKTADQNLSVKKFRNALDAINSLKSPLPKLIFLDILLPGPDGFTFLNEISSYSDSSKIPVILVTSLKLPETDLRVYGVRGILDKETMKPEEVTDYVRKFAI